MRECVKQCMELIEKLDHQFQQGKGDDKEADDIRDQMDPLWNAMTTDEQDQIRARLREIK